MGAPCCLALVVNAINFLCDSALQLSGRLAPHLLRLDGVLNLHIALTLKIA